MESLGAFPNGEWDFFGQFFATDENEFTPQFLGQSSLLLGDDDGLNIGLIQSTFCSSAPEEASENEHMFCSLSGADDNSNLQYISQGSSYNRSNCSEDNFFIDNHQGLTTNFYYSYPDHVLANDASISMDFCMDEKNHASFVPSLSDIVMKESVNFSEDVGSDRLENSDHTQMEPMVSPTKQLQLKRKLEVPEEMPAEDKANNRSNNQKKKPCVLKDVQGCMKNARSRKNNNHKVAGDRNEAEGTYHHAGSDGQSSSCNISEDDNASQENSTGGATSVSKSAPNSNGKPRASRGSATDPQSLYARKRRERINERLRILQNLVPNGTKVDISTMLEEAVNYVKFLQLQIKLLSSDDLWMYAPLAYNGLDIGLNLNMKNSLLD